MTRDFHATDNDRFFRLTATGEIGRIEFPVAAEDLVESVLRIVQNHYALTLRRPPHHSAGDSADFAANVIAPARLEIATRAAPGVARLWLEKKRPSGFGFIYVVPGDVEPAPPWTQEAP